MTRARRRKPAPAPAPELDQAVAIREVLGFPARLMAQLPAPWTLRCVDGQGRELVFSSDYEARVRAPCAFDARDFHKLAVAAENERADAGDMVRWVTAKISDPEWRLTWAEAMAGMRRDTPEHWPVARVLERLGLTLARVESS